MKKFLVMIMALIVSFSCSGRGAGSRQSGTGISRGIGRRIRRR